MYGDVGMGEWESVGEHVATKVYGHVGMGEWESVGKQVSIAGKYGCVDAYGRVGEY